MLITLVIVVCAGNLEPIFLPILPILVGGKIGKITSGAGQDWQDCAPILNAKSVLNAHRTATEIIGIIAILRRKIIRIVILVTILLLFNDKICYSRTMDFRFRV